MNRLYIAVGAFLLILGLAWLALSQHDGKLRESIRADAATQVVSEAVAESKAAVKADVRAQAKKAVALDSVRHRLVILRENNIEKSIPAWNAPALVQPDPWVGLFNDAVRASNEAIESSSSMSGTL